MEATNPVSARFALCRLPTFRLRRQPEQIHVLGQRKVGQGAGIFDRKPCEFRVLVVHHRRLAPSPGSDQVHVVGRFPTFLGSVVHHAAQNLMGYRNDTDFFAQLPMQSFLQRLPFFDTTTDDVPTARISFPVCCSLTKQDLSIPLQDRAGVVAQDTLQMLTVGIMITLAASCEAAFSRLRSMGRSGDPVRFFHSSSPDRTVRF